MAKQTANAKIEDRFAKIETELARLTQKVEQDAPGSVDVPKSKTKMKEFLENVVGVFAGKPAFLDATQLGAEWRASFRPKRRQSPVKKRGKDARARH